MYSVTFSFNISGTAQLETVPQSIREHSSGVVKELLEQCCKFQLPSQDNVAGNMKKKKKNLMTSDHSQEDLTALISS